MRRLIEWIKFNKITAILGLIVLYLLVRGSPRFPILQREMATAPQVGYGGVVDMDLELGAPQSVRSKSILPPFIQESAPTTDVAERLVVQETELSLLVNDVRMSIDTMIDYVKQQGGYMVSSNLTQPEEAPFGTLIVRVPSDKLREIMEHFRSLSIKVSSEYVQGYDVTDEYLDIDARLKTLETTKARFEQIMDSAVEIDDILRVQQEIINLQSQIDSLKGRQLYLEQTAKLARITAYLSTDEIALPYTPSETFRPAVIAKLAWRSLVQNVRKVAAVLIWISIYAVIWVPVLGLVLLVKRRLSNKPVKG